MRTVGVSTQGRLVGQYSPSAALTDAEVEQMRTLHERDGWSAKALAEKFEVSRSLTEKILRYERRVAAYEAWRTPREKQVEKGKAPKVKVPRAGHYKPGRSHPWKVGSAARESVVDDPSSSNAG